IDVGAEVIDQGALDPDTKLRQKRRRRKIIGALIIILLMTVVGAATAYYLVRRTNLDVIIGGRTRHDRVDRASGDHGLTQQAIKEARDATKGAEAAPTPQVTMASPPVATPTENLAGTITAPSAGQGTGTEPKAEARTDAAPGTLRTTDGAASRRNIEKSIRMVEATPPRTDSVKTAAATRHPVRKDAPEAVVPNFGTMLPVRSLGAIYTLRSGSLTRFELTRDVSGEGWSLKRGTVFVGTLRGSEYDRAYLSMIGFIDPATKRLVKVGGDVLGSDGGNGLRGKRRRLSSRWTRVVGEGLRNAVSMTQSALSGRGGGTTIILPGVQGAVQPELMALSGKGNSREFVEVAAGAPAYVMITDLPEEVRGVDAVTELAPTELTQALDREGQSTGPSLTDADLATLLSEGSPEQIRAALPRMTPQMRRVAEAVLQQTER
ncbi:MAG: hypothetical protein M3R15_09650, partial [Acidobacteriota bacterium]|nr:hypothetical protein [Acidobacteriota bacterium]